MEGDEEQKRLCLPTLQNLQPKHPEEILGGATRHMHALLGLHGFSLGLLQLHQKAETYGTAVFGTWHLTNYMVLGAVTAASPVTAAVHSYSHCM